MARSLDTHALEALREGRGYAVLHGWRLVDVRGGDALPWLNDLLSADLAGLAPGEARRSLLLSPTGRIRADVAVAALTEGLLLVQDPVQPAPIDALLAPYVLAAEVTLVDRSADHTVVAFPGAEPPEGLGETYRPSVVGAGTDVVVRGEPPADVGAGDRVEASLEAVDAWRIERGRARFGVDLREDSLPHEAGLDHAIGYGKGCFLGQEAVARVRNLGHPPFVVLAGLVEGAARAGEEVADGGHPVGVVTSAAPLPDGATAVVIRVRWAAREATLRTGSGVPLRLSGPAAGPAA